MKIVFATLGLTFDGSTIHERGLGGSESCLVYMARAMAKLGHEVHVYNRCEKEGEHEGVEYHAIKKAQDVTADVFFSYRWPELAKAIKATVNILVCHDMPVMAKQMNEELWMYQGVIFLTKFQQDQYRPRVSLIDRMSIVSANGVDWELATRVREGAQKRDLLLFAARPERGMDFLLEHVWPRIRNRHPDMELGITGYVSWADNQVKELYEKCQRLIQTTPGVTEYGSLSKPRWYELMAQARLVLYPCRFPEIFCLNATESAACGTPIVTTDGWALKETAKHGVLVPGRMEEGLAYVDRYTAAVERMLANADDCYDESVVKGLEYAETLDWNKLAEQWDTYARALLKEEQERVKPTVSVCMITRNEEHDITRAIASVQAIADEVLVYDSESEDRTVQRAEEMGAVVRTISKDPDGDGLFNFAWARNKSIEHAKSEWVLWLDADEVMVGLDRLQKYLRSKVHDAFRIRQVNLHMVARLPGAETPIRLFRTGRGARFVGVIHETMEFEQDAGAAPVLQDAELAHYGYVSPDGNFRKLLQRNLLLLEKERRLGSSRTILPIYVMRDMLNLAHRALKQDGMTDQVVRLFWHVVEEGTSRFAQTKNPLYAKLAREMVQKALENLANSGRYKDSIKKVSIGLKVLGPDADGKEPYAVTEAWFYSKRQALRVIHDMVEKKLSEQPWNEVGSKT